MNTKYYYKKDSLSNDFPTDILLIESVGRLVAINKYKQNICEDDQAVEANKVQSLRRLENESKKIIDSFKINKEEKQRIEILIDEIEKGLLAAGTDEEKYALINRYLISLPHSPNPLTEKILRKTLIFHMAETISNSAFPVVPTPESTLSGLVESNKILTTKNASQLEQIQKFERESEFFQTENANLQANLNAAQNIIHNLTMQLGGLQEAHPELNEEISTIINDIHLEATTLTFPEKPLPIELPPKSQIAKWADFYMGKLPNTKKQKPKYRNAIEFFETYPIYEGYTWRDYREANLLTTNYLQKMDRALYQRLYDELRPFGKTLSEYIVRNASASLKRESLTT